jgi:small multidrug resistance pump
MDSWRSFRWWFGAAAIYNALWGAVASVWPNAIFDGLRIPRPCDPALFQCIGMMVGVYAFGYWLVALDPERFGAFVWVGLAGKVLGPVGFLASAVQGRLPWSFGWINVTNDLIWLPAFVLFALKLHREVGRFGLATIRGPHHRL